MSQLKQRYDKLNNLLKAYKDGAYEGQEEWFIDYVGNEIIWAKLYMRDEKFFLKTVSGMNLELKEASRISKLIADLSYLCRELDNITTEISKKLFNS